MLLISSSSVIQCFENILFYFRNVYFCNSFQLTLGQLNYDNKPYSQRYVTK